MDINAPIFTVHYRGTFTKKRWPSVTARKLPDVYHIKTKCVELGTSWYLLRRTPREVCATKANNLRGEGGVSMESWMA